MRQTGVVVSKNGDIAEVRVERASMCEGCTHNHSCTGHSCAAGNLMGAGKTMMARAYNKAEAEVGDIVALETPSGKVLSYAALVFLVPILCCGVFYTLGNILFHTLFGSCAMAICGFLLSFCCIAYVERRMEKRKPEIVICTVLPKSTIQENPPVQNNQ